MSERISEHIDREYESVERPEPGDVDAAPDEPEADPDQAPDDLDPDEAPVPEDEDEDEDDTPAQSSNAQGW
jgi:hypothetical protein